MIRLRLSTLRISALVPLLAVVGLAILPATGAGCSTTSSSPGALAGGVACTASVTAGDASAARVALTSATAGNCVVLTASSYAGPFTVPAGAALVAHDGARVTITGGTANDPAVSLGEGAELAGVDVVGAGGVGIAIRAANALVSDVTVSGAKSAALAILCKAGTTASCSAGTVVLTNVQLSQSGLGLWISGAHVAMKGGGSSSHAGTSLASAAGVVAQDGAQLELDGVTVEKNEGVGVLVDGASTTASIKNGTVNENGERGVWAQRIAGTLDAPSLRIEGTTVTKNRIVGVGAVESHGIIIVSGRIAETVAAPLVTNLSSTEQVGDGVGIFNSGDFKLDGTLLEANARAAGISDGSDRGIIIVSGKVGAGPSGLKFVVQNTKGGDVQVADTDRSTPPVALGVSAPKLALPPVL